ncbi:MAG TPA: threonine ammonia-lyase [Dehalococcoidia bacterium]|nr:threonine ammonia-lyase [Dehalococcoidia bacterium]
MADQPTVTLADIEAARVRTRGLVRTTPLWPSRVLSELAGISVSLKCENLQHTGSFKVRGAVNMLRSIERPGGVIAASAGNHAQAVAMAASGLDLPSTVVVPADAPLAKQRATEGYGAELIRVDGPLSLAIEHAQELATERGLVFIPPFDDPSIVAGQGTVALELLEQAPDVEAVLVPAGGGGLLAGIATAVKAMRPDVTVIGVQTAAMPGIAVSRVAGEARSVEAARTIADGVAVAGPSALTHSLIERFVDEVVTVSEEQIAQAVLFLLERARLVIEGAGALGVAALLSGAVVPEGPTVAVLSGGNIDINLIGRIVERGLLIEGRRRRMTVAAANVPGELARITGGAAEVGANIIEVEHELVTADLPAGVARITLHLEVADDDAYERLIDHLIARGLVPGDHTDLMTAAAASMPS